MSDKGSGDAWVLEAITVFVHTSFLTVHAWCDANGGEDSPTQRQRQSSVRLIPWADICISELQILLAFLAILQLSLDLGIDCPSSAC